MDLVPLDLGVPDMDGTSVILGPRAWTTVSITVLSGRDDPLAKTHALHLGLCHQAVLDKTSYDGGLWRPDRRRARHGRVLALTAAGVGVASTPLGALAAALPIWALDTGFVLTRLGTLTLDQRTAPALITITLAGTGANVLRSLGSPTMTGQTRRGPVEQPGPELRPSC